jgi:hypothetical protein
MFYAASLFLFLATAAAAQPVEIGAWRLACTTDRMTDRGVCLLRHRDWAEPPAAGQTGLSLEILDRGGRLVPAVTARDLGLEQAARGLLAVAGTAQLRFPPQRLLEMPCGLEGRNLICAPRPEDAARAEAELPLADRALVRMTGLSGGKPDEPAELPLVGTRDALARFRREVPAGSTPPPEPPPGLEVRELLQRLQRLLGY